MSDLFGTAPPEDIGAETQARYRWQHHGAARDCVAMLTQPAIARIVCEFHEDHVVEFADGELELVSSKYRTASSGPWTLHQLTTAGLAHLFDRWCPVKDIARARLLTNAALKPGATEARALRQACDDFADVAEPTDEPLTLPGLEGVDDSTADLEKLTQVFVVALLAARRSKTFSSIPFVAATAGSSATTRRARMEPEATAEQLAAFTDDVRDFMKVLHIESDQPAIEHIDSVGALELMQPALAVMGRTCSPATAYQVVVDLVAERNRATRPASGLAAFLATPARNATSSQLAALVSVRTIERQDIVERLPASSAAVPLKAGAAAVPPTLSRLVVKMREGGIGETAIAQAVDLRQTWLRTWEEARSGLPGDADALYDLQMRVWDVAAQAESEHRTDDATYGQAMLATLRQSLTVDALGYQPPIDLERLHLLGLAFDLCAMCRVYFSEKFDVDTAVAVLDRSDLAEVMSRTAGHGPSAAGSGQVGTS